jgi:hypothetical protein
MRDYALTLTHEPAFNDLLRKYQKFDETYHDERLVSDPKIANQDWSSYPLPTSISGPATQFSAVQFASIDVERRPHCMEPTPSFIDHDEMKSYDEILAPFKPVSLYKTEPLPSILQVTGASVLLRTCKEWNPPKLFPRLERRPSQSGLEGFREDKPQLSDAILNPSLLPLPRLKIQRSNSEQGGTQESFHEEVFEKRATEATGMEDHVDAMTTVDSGYHSGTRYSCTNLGDGDLIDNDNDSVVTDGWPNSLPRQDKYMLEAEFAREMFNRSSAQTREQFSERGQTVTDLLYSFSVMIGGRASSAAERGAASFVRRGRK